MAKAVKLYWDSCAWLGLINGEADKKRELDIVYGHAKGGHYQLWASTLSVVEVRRLESEKDDPKPLSAANLAALEALFLQPFVKMIPLDMEIAGNARRLFRETTGLGKYQDAVHLASALKWNLSTLHTYDRDDLLHLDGALACGNGEKLRICYPDETTDGPLFAKRA